MSAGLGNLQRSIIEGLSDRRPELQKVLLWKLAFARDEISKDYEKWGDIEKGRIRKSFIENFRRAIKSLNDSGEILISKNKFETLEDLLVFLPYLTPRLELQQLSKKLLPTIKEFAKENNTSFSTKIDFESYQANQLKKDENVFQSYQNAWNIIEEKILQFLLNAGSVRNDIWLNILLRGRFLFKNRREEYKTPLFILVRKLSTGISPGEIEIYGLLQDLISRLSDNPYWKIGQIKGNLYNFFHAEMFFAGRLSEELKYFLFEKHSALLKSLPGHNEPDESIYFGRVADHFRKFSPLLDQLINRHVLRPQISLKLPEKS